jgi:hypothetical protein
LLFNGEISFRLPLLISGRHDCHSGGYVIGVQLLSLLLPRSILQNLGKTKKALKQAIYKDEIKNQNLMPFQF